MRSNVGDLLDSNLALKTLAIRRDYYYVAHFGFTGWSRGCDPGL